MAARKKPIRVSPKHPYVSATGEPLPIGTLVWEIVGHPHSQDKVECRFDTEADPHNLAPAFNSSGKFVGWYCPQGHGPKRKDRAKSIPCSAILQGNQVIVTINLD